MIKPDYDATRPYVSHATCAIWQNIGHEAYEKIDSQLRLDMRRMTTERVARSNGDGIFVEEPVRGVVIYALNQIDFGFEA